MHTGHIDIAKGGDLTPAKMLLKNLAKRELWQDMGMVICTVANGIWIRERLFKAGMVDDDMCLRRMLATETAFHRYWMCPANALVENTIAIRTSEHFYATSEASKSSAQLTRGIVPSTAYPKIPPPPRRALVSSLFLVPYLLTLGASLFLLTDHGVRLDPMLGFAGVDGHTFRCANTSQASISLIQECLRVPCKLSLVRS